MLSTPTRISVHSAASHVPERVASRLIRQVASARPVLATAASRDGWQPQLAPPMRFKRAMEHYYSARSATYDSEGAFHPDMMAHIVQLAELAPGQRVLDLCAGTGLFALQAAHEVGPTGCVTAVDFSRPMLDVLASKADTLPGNNLRLICADVEALRLPPQSFDRVVCASALVLLRDISAALRAWRELLAPDGLMVVDGPSDTSFVQGVLIAEAVDEMGLDWPVDQVLATEARARCLFDGAGLEMVSFSRSEHGGMLTRPQLQRGWDRSLPFIEPAVPPEMRAAVHQRYLEKADAWLGGRDARPSPGTMHYVVARPATRTADAAARPH